VVINEVAGPEFDEQPRCQESEPVLRWDDLSLTTPHGGFADPLSPQPPIIYAVGEGAFVYYIIRDRVLFRVHVKVPPLVSDTAPPAQPAAATQPAPSPAPKATYYVLVLRDGRRIVTRTRVETEDEVIVKDDAGRTHTLRKSDIVETRTVSLQ
jgi:hypothetical protein